MSALDDTPTHDTTGYGQLKSPISGFDLPNVVPHSTRHGVGKFNSAESPTSDWPNNVQSNRYGNETFTIGPLHIDTKPSSNLAERRKSIDKSKGTEAKFEEKEGEKTKTKSKPKSGSAHDPSSKPSQSSNHNQAESQPRPSWEPVSPGIADRSPEVLATVPKKEYYWPKEGVSEGSSKSSAASNAAASSSSYPSIIPAAHNTARRTSKAVELGYDVSGLEGGMVSLTNLEFRGLLKSALLSNDVATSRHLLTTPLPKKVGIIRCCIKRHKSGLMNTFFPTYEAFLEEPEKPIFMMSSKKRTKNKTSNYTISLLSLSMLQKSKSEASMTSEDPNYLGKVRSNFSGSEFVGYDAGISPKTFLANSGSSSSSHSWIHGDRRPSESKLSNLRQELCQMLFEQNILSRCPRKFTCIIPGMLQEDDSKRIVCKPLVPSDSLLYQYKALQQTEAEKKPKLHAEQIAYKEITVLGNKEPVWEQAIGAFCLNFHGRATIASVKNFQLIDQHGDKNRVILQFGKIDKDLFTMDVQYPLSILQAFEISLAGLDTKLYSVLSKFFAIAPEDHQHSIR